VTDTTEIAAAAPASTGTVDLSTLRLPQLQAVASQLGISGTGRMRKSELLEAIQTKQNGGTPAVAAAPARTSRRAAAPAGAPTRTKAAQVTTVESAAPVQAAAVTTAPVKSTAAPVTSPPAPAAAPVEAPPVAVEAAAVTEITTEAPADRASSNGAGDQPVVEREPRTRTRNRDGQNRDTQNRDTQNRDGAPAREGQAREGGQAGQSRESQPRENQNREGGQAREGQNREGGQAREGQNRDGQAREGQARDGQGRNNNQARNGQNRDGQVRDNQARDNQARGDQGRNDQPRNDQDDDEDGDARGRRRRGRFRDRKRRPRDGEPGALGNQMADDSEVVNEDDVVLPVAGILDVLDSYAFLRTSGYLPGPNDVYVSLGQVKKYGLRKGDAVTGAVRQPREGETQQNQRAKFNALVRMDTVNGAPPDEARGRVEFGKLTPLYPQERLRLETESHSISNRIIDLVAPIGKGQRGLIVSPPKAGKTLILQAIANAISVNNPECHLMVVLVDERPEEVTDLEREIDCQIYHSNFDENVQRHVQVAELVLERAKRLVEMKRDVVILLDSITRLSRGYNSLQSGKGRTMSGGVESKALTKPKKFFGSARNAEEGGSLTILATALTETGSRMDEVIFEEFKGTGNMELHLDRSLQEKRLYPAIHPLRSATRREELLYHPDEWERVQILRKTMAALPPIESMEKLIENLEATKTNAELLLSGLR
jgi:transcription termination factor Rho